MARRAGPWDGRVLLICSRWGISSRSCRMFSFASTGVGANFLREVATVCDFSCLLSGRDAWARGIRSVWVCTYARARARTEIDRGFPRELFIRRHFVRARPREPPCCDPRLLRFCGFVEHRGAGRHSASSHNSEFFLSCRYISLTLLICSRNVCSISNRKNYVICFSFCVYACTPHRLT